MNHAAVDSDLELKQLAPRDAPELFALTDANRSYLRQWLPWLDNIRAVADTLKFIEHTLATYVESGAFVCGMWYRGGLAGTIGLNKIEKDNDIAHIGYWIAQPLQGRGIVTRCAREVVRHSFESLNMNRLEICAAVGNDRSQSTATRLGFAREGIRREGERLYDRYVDLVVFGLTKSMWLLNSAKT